ncbi:MAG TPA: UDP-3-O-(3-hydroxymyristoyl)glucosamine N-acyltransferase [Pyrinomonadaceae bacterium]|jgi:UDP-3-O-[3-hydroxymyristoyl] glucosamine N-acyltransferase|nr:UDP-3-O-(3-hydroxymyristoyl)glucosamine N-acyltransferase [Pyrinomonadaceae bacterium]
MTVNELAQIVGGRVAGDPETQITRIADLENADEGEIAYVENEKLLDAAAASRASCLIVRDGFAEKFPARTVIEVANPKLAFALIGAALHPPLRREPAIHPTAVVAETADIALTAYVGPNVCVGEYTHVGTYTRLEAGVVLGANVTVGDHCVLHPNVVLYDGVTIGNGVILHAGVCLGADGFGYVRHDLGYQKFPQIGTVVIEDDVEIGAHTTVDRAALGRTRIGRGTKLDNMVHVGHNCDIGERVVIAAQTGISGSVVIEDDAVIGGQVGFGDHTRVQSGAIIGSKAGILPGKIVRPGVWWGIPIQPLDQYKRMNANLNRLPQMREEIKRLQEQIEELRQKLATDNAN